jgi:hypothetical protein
MDWLPVTMYWTAFGLYPVPYPPRAAPAPSVSPADLDLRLIRAAYEVTAAESGCTRCGSSLGRRIRLVPHTGPAAWRVSVSVRCRGPWRHRHLAVAAEDAGHLELGPLRSVRPARSARTAPPARPDADTVAHEQGRP